MKLVVIHILNKICIIFLHFRSTVTEGALLSEGGTKLSQGYGEGKEN